MADLCPVFDTTLNSHPTGIGTTADVREYSCPRCGLFRLTSELYHSLPTLLSANKNNRAKISHALRRAQEANNSAYLSETTFTKMLEIPFPRPSEQADLLIRWMALHPQEPGEIIQMSSASLSAIIGAKNEAGFFLVANHLKDVGLITLTRVIPPPGKFNDCIMALTFNGWERYEKLRTGTVFYRKAFMAMQYGDPSLDAIFENTFKTSTQRAGFNLIRQDQTHHAGLIDNRMRVEIQSADFLIADLTHRNPGAYWEAGYAEGLGKPVIFTCEKAEFERNRTHFDTNHHLTIVWDSNVPDVAGEELTATIRATLPHLAKMSD